MKVLIILSVILSISSMAFAKSLSKAELEKIIANSGNKLNVLEFHATWCPACQNIDPIVDELTVLHKKDVVITKIDVDENEQLSLDYEITNLPTFVFFKNNRKVDQFSGAETQELKDTIKRLK